MNKKNFFLTLLLTLITVLFILNLGFINDSLNFSGSNAYSIAKELSSAEYDGRKPGTTGNIKALRYTEGQISKNTGFTFYHQSFEALVPELTDTPVFELLKEDGSTVKIYYHRKDFKEYIDGYASGGEFVSNFIVDKENVESAIGKKFKDKIVVVNNNYLGYPFEDKIYINAGVKVLIFPVSSENVKKASGYVGESKEKYIKDGLKLIKIGVTESVYDFLIKLDKDNKNGSGYKLKISVPLIFKKVQTENLIAIKMSNSSSIKKDIESKYLTLTAHIDHLGKDPSGKFFPGALDNGSGVGFVLEMARVLSLKVLDANLVIILFNAEENGLVGSHFYSLYPLFPLDKTEIFNFDMIGASEKSVLSLLYYETNFSSKMTKVSKQIKDFFSQEGKYLSVDSMSEDTDHYFFNLCGTSAYSFNQFPETNYHTYNDTIENVSPVELESIGKTFEKYIVANYSTETKAASISLLNLLLIAGFVLLRLKQEISYGKKI
ncbi:MAG: Zn-dependent exopeptidase M28 [Spirochaetes bacterium]|nr:Zn-dependent exopeptidase M28 [Spirochaetota bacterium]NLJ05204.1 Zn-dependent exopeptidase M28 [Exilispira sp.]MBP8990954.1 Zn-dependent exopeptidase M28 [Spirochaetota bacterium]HNV43410.1 M28 family metallopeptidase [Exilispira sp.]HOV46151.1 M28 family metallopeptidase [Exilispira sp.]